MEVESNEHQVKPHKKGKLAVREAATQESRAGGRDQGPLLLFYSAL